MADAGRIIPIHKGDWTIHDAYEVLDQVYYAGSTYIAKNNIADSATTPNVDTTNWILSARGFDADTLAGVTGIDTSGVLGTIGATVSGQALIDEIADRVATKLLPISNLANNGTTTEIGQYALDANYGKTLTDELVTVNINLTATDNKLNEISGTASTNKPYGGFPINQDSYVTVDKVKNVNLYARVDANLVQNQYTTIAFIGAEYRPQNNFKTLIGHVIDGTTGAWTTPLSCFVYSTGEIKVYTSLASGAYKVAVVGCYSKY